MEKKTIKYEKLLDALSYNNPNSFLEELGGSGKEPELGCFGSYYNEYFDRLKNKIKEFDISEQVIIEYSKEIPILESGYTYHTKYRVIVKNLTIEVDKESLNKLFYFDSVAIREASKYNDGWFITFIDNDFISTGSVRKSV